MEVPKMSLESIGRELKNNPPKVLATTRRRYGPKRADKQRVRKAGVKGAPWKPSSK
jgi:hypothetical protein